MRRNFSAIRKHLREGAPLDACQAALLSDMSAEDVTDLASISDKVWVELCNQLRGTDMFHDDLESPALPSDLLFECCERIEAANWG